MHPRLCGTAPCCLLRFTHALRLLPQSIKRLHTTLAWRLANNPEQTVCAACARKPRSHYMHIVGYCRQGRPCVYSCNGLATNKDCADNKQHLIQTFEMVSRSSPRVAQPVIMAPMGTAEGVNLPPAVFVGGLPRRPAASSNIVYSLFMFHCENEQGIK